MFKTRMYRILTGNRALFLACDQGLEHGPSDFNLDNINPDYILGIAEKGGYNGMILHHGIAEKYYENYKEKVRLIVKLNGKTGIADVAPYAGQVCSVSRAVKLGADAVGYTIYVGSSREAEMFSEFGKIVEQAHDYGMPVIAWMYPRGQFVKNDTETSILAHSARVGLELGADIVKMKYNNDKPGYKWIVKAAGRCKVVIAGGQKETAEKIVAQAKEIIECGAIGMAIGRNVWQSDRPLELTKALKRVIIENMKVEDALKALKE